MRKSSPVMKTPVMLQLESAECGAVCLGIILAYHKAFYSLDVLRKACHVSRDGSKASDVLRSASQFHLTGKAYKKESLDDLKTWHFPLIIFWEFNHFVVLEGVKNNTVYLNDPATGRRKVTLDQFNKAFTGVVLELTPAEKFKPVGKPLTVWSLLKENLKAHKLSLFFLLAVGGLLLVPVLLLPVLTKLFVDHILIEGQTHWMRGFMMASLICLAAYALLLYLQKQILLRLEMVLSVQMSSNLLWHLLHLPMSFFGQRQQGELASRVALNSRIASAVTSQVIQLAVQLLTAVFFLAVMATYHLSLTFLVALIACLNLAVMAKLLQNKKDAVYAQAREEGKLAGESLKGLDQIETLKATGREQDFFQKWAGIQASTINSNQTSQKTLFKVQLLPAFFMGVTQLLVLGIGGIDVMEGNLSIGGLIAFQALSLAFLKPVFEALKASQLLQQLESDLFRIRDVYEFEKETHAEPGKKNILSAPIQGKIEIQKLSFCYAEGSQPILDQITATILPNQCVAFVGKSGSGKSTLAKLICGLYPPSSGKILFEGHSLAVIPPEELADHLAMVDQDIMIFEDTIHYNLTLWDPRFSDQDITKAAQEACIHDDIVARPFGYNATLMEGGKNLSGGQAQRLEIARALLNSPKVLLLDEATSALDPIVESKILDAIRKRGCTTIMIAHRLSTVRDCDRIFVLDNGKLIEQGTHQELLDQKGAYADLIKESHD